ncbi:5165_t:CDS:1, partial [Gigaspora margarita]
NNNNNSSNSQEKETERQGATKNEGDHNRPTVNMAHAQTILAQLLNNKESLN